MAIIGLVLILGALAALGYALLGQPRVALERRSPGPVQRLSPVEVVSRSLVGVVDSVLRRRGWRPLTTAELEIAGIGASASSIVTATLVLSGSLLVAGTVVGGNVLVGIMAALVIPVGAKVALAAKASRRRHAFAEQLEDCLQLIASALRAGHSMARAIDTVARESEPPMSTEAVRIVNENRLGRDLVVAMEGTAERMRSDDFRWIAEAVAIHRQSGGNLNEVLDRVGETLRERSAIREKVKSLAAEGVYSAYVIMALPIFVTLVYVVMNPTYAGILFGTQIGWFSMGGGLVLYVIGGIWMRAVVKVKV